MMRAVRSAVVLLLAPLALGGCRQLIGIEDHRLRPECQTTNCADASSDATADTSDLDASDAGAQTDAATDASVDAPADVDALTDAAGDGPSDSGSDSTCNACDAPTCETPTDGVYYVDSEVGSDGLGSAGCPFRTLTHAFEVVAAARALNGGDFEVVVVHSVTEATEGTGTFPLSVPAHTTLRGADPINRPTITAPANTGALVFSAGPAALRSLTITRLGANTSSGGVSIENGGTATVEAVTIDHVYVSNFFAGIHVLDHGLLNLGDDVLVVQNQLGLHVVDGRVLVSAETAVNGVQFNDNASGIWLEGTVGVLDLRGAPGGRPADRTISTLGNTNMGIRVGSTIASDPETGLVNEISNVASNGNGADGLRVVGGTAVVVRNSAFFDNVHSGVRVQELNGDNDFTRIDLGNIAASSAGQNAFVRNTPAICLGVTTTSLPGPLWAEGNTFQGVDCALASPNAVLSAAQNCDTNVPIGITAAVTPTDSIVHVANCTLP